MNPKILTTVSVLAMLSLAVFCCFSAMDDSSATRPDHITERGTLNNLSNHVYEVDSNRFYGTVLNPYKEVNIDVVGFSGARNIYIYVLQGSSVSIHFNGQCEYGHTSHLNRGWTYSNGTYHIGSLNHSNSDYFNKSGCPSVFIENVEKAGWVTDNTDFYRFCCSQTEPLIGIDMESTGYLPGFDFIYVAAGSKVRMCAYGDEWSAKMIYGNRIGLGSYIGNYLRCDNVTVGEDTIRLINEIEPGLYQDIPIKVIAYNENFLVNFNANGGSCDLISKRYQEGTSFSLPNATKDYSNFLGWYTELNGGTRVGGAGDSYKVNGNITLYAHYEKASVKIISELSEAYCIMGSSFSYIVITEPEDCIITVSGASWLSITGNQIYGVPVDVTSGTYHITITATFGNGSDSQFVDLIVVKKLDFESIPTGGIIVRPTVIA